MLVVCYFEHYFWGFSGYAFAAVEKVRRVGHWRILYYACGFKAALGVQNLDESSQRFSVAAQLLRHQKDVPGPTSNRSSAPILHPSQDSETDYRIRQSASTLKLQLEREDLSTRYQRVKLAGSDTPSLLFVSCHRRSCREGSRHIHQSDHLPFARRSLIKLASARKLGYCHFRLRWCGSPSSGTVIDEAIPVAIECEPCIV